MTDDLIALAAAIRSAETQQELFDIADRLGAIVALRDRVAPVEVDGLRAIVAELRRRTWLSPLTAQQLNDRDKVLADAIEQNLSGFKPVADRVAPVEADLPGLGAYSPIRLALTAEEVKAARNYDVAPVEADAAAHTADCGCYDCDHPEERSRTNG